MINGFVKVCAASPTVKIADCVFNAKNIVDTAKNVADSGVQVIVTPELSISGYSCGDFFAQNTLQNSALSACATIMKATEKSNIILVVGLPIKSDGALFNCMLALYKGVVLGGIAKTRLSASELRCFSAPSKTNHKIRVFGKEIDLLQKTTFQCKELSQFSFSLAFSYGGFVPQCEKSGNILLVSASEAEYSSSAAQRCSNITTLSAQLKCAIVLANASIGESTTDNAFAGQCIVAENGKILSEGRTFTGECAISDIDILAVDGMQGSSEHTCCGDVASEIFSFPPLKNKLSRQLDAFPYIGNKYTLDNTLEIQARALAGRLAHISAKTLVLGISGGLDSTLALLVCKRCTEILELPTENIYAYTLPSFGTTSRSKGNAEKLAKLCGATFDEINIAKTVTQHFEDIGHDINDHSIVFENAQARIRTLVLMDKANALNGLFVGTGDLSELALGWATYNGDHMSMYSVNGSISKTLMRAMVANIASDNTNFRDVLTDILDTPVSPELLPAQNDKNSQHTEEIVGPYELHDFTLYYMLKTGMSPKYIVSRAENAFNGKYTREEIKKWMQVFYKRFFSQQFKRSCMPDGPDATGLSLSPRGGLCIPSDAQSSAWLQEIAQA